MIRRVVDTNVAIVANGRSDSNASIECHLAAIEFLNEMATNGCVIVDLDGEIQEEYRKHLKPSGQPGVGDRFYQLILLSSPLRVQRIALPRHSTGEYVDFPTDPALAPFDPSDRKFAAAAKKSSCPVVNATDSDWLSYESVLRSHGIRVQFLCGRNTAKWVLAT